MLPRIAASASGRVASRDRANDKLAPSYHKTSGQALLLIWRDYTIPNRGRLTKGISESAEFDSTGRMQAGSSWRRRLGFEGIMMQVLRGDGKKVEGRPRMFTVANGHGDAL